MGSALSGVYPTRSSVGPRREQTPSSKPGRGRHGVAGLRFTFLATDETSGAAVGQVFLDIFLRGPGRQNQEIGVSSRRLLRAEWEFSKPPLYLPPGDSSGWVAMSVDRSRPATPKAQKGKRGKL